jgi:DNA replication initiation complex subunit (GINS family)
MDYLSIAAAVVTKGIVPLFKTLATRTMEEAGREAGKELVDNRAKILDTVKDLFAGDELITLGLLERDPDNEAKQSKVVEAIETKLTANPDVAKNLKQLTTTLAVIKNIDVKTSELVNTIRLARDQAAKLEISNEKINNSNVKNEITSG